MPIKLILNALAFLCFMNFTQANVQMGDYSPNETLGSCESHMQNSDMTCAVSQSTFSKIGGCGTILDIGNLQSSQTKQCQVLDKFAG